MIGQRLLHYGIESQLGQGGRGVVYPHAPLETRDDVLLIVRRLRQGSTRAWQAAREIEQCL